MTRDRGDRPLILCLGGINMDLVTFSERLPADGETVVGERFVTYPGGKGANQAVAAARMETESAMIGKVGDDMFGPQLIDLLRSAGVETGAVGVAPETNSGIAVISVGEGGQNRIVQVLGANDTCGDAEYYAAAALLPQASALMLQLEVSIGLSIKVAELAASQGVRVILDPGPVRPVPGEFYRHVSVITPNETEAEALVGYPVTDVDTAASAAEELLARGVGSAVIKLGAQGAYWADGLASGMVPAFAVQAVDTVAAGDAFNGALAVALSEGHPLESAVRWGCAAGALSVTRVGAQDSMPERDAVQALLEQST
ncbi:MAG: ribokinase [Chloroflexota bacterium]|nr:ribokinase [Chloroflexota bacterium]MDE2960556.1 ribokinase [Chloroflexota bacterium]